MNIKHHKYKHLQHLSTDYLLIGAGVMSATLGTILRLTHPNASIMISERLKDCSLESSDALNNAGTGHAGYYPHSQFLDVIVDEVKFDFMEDYVKFYIEESKRKYKTKKEIIDNTQIVLNNRGIGVTKKHIRELLNKND